jgi:hypothetical protein
MVKLTDGTLKKMRKLRRKNDTSSIYNAMAQQGAVEIK